MRHGGGFHLGAALLGLGDTERTGTQPKQSYDGGDDRVDDSEATGSSGKLKTEATVDDAQDHEKAAVPDVDVTENSTGLRLAVIDVVDNTEDGLQGKQGDDKDSKACVGLVEELRGRGHVSILPATNYLKWVEVVGIYSQCHHDGQHNIQDRIRPTYQENLGTARWSGGTTFPTKASA